MNESKKGFIEFMFESNVLKFGNFIAKSGRETPYFINTGFYNDGNAIDKLGRFYAGCINEYVKKEINTIYGPSYKGIPLAVGAAVSMKLQYGKNIHFSFNRKEAKDHGEGGLIVGYTPKDGDNIVIVEDVITSGISINESIGILNSLAKVNILAIIISVDRMEKGNSEKSAIQEIRDKYNIPVYAIVTIEDIVDYVYNEKKDGKKIINDEMKRKIEERIVK